MKKGFWTVVGECVKRQAGGTTNVVAEIDPEVIEKSFDAEEGWYSEGLPPWWAEILINDDFHDSAFPWRVARAGSKLRFTPK